MRAGIASAAVALLALILGACGSGGDSASTATPSVGGVGGSESRVIPLEVSGGGSAQFRVKDGDNSIQEYGSEAGTGELRRAAEVVHGYFTALAREDWMGACSRMSSREAGQIEQLGSRSAKSGSCASALAALIGRVTVAEAREATVVDAASLRRQGAHGFLIYRGAHGKPYSLSLAWEDGGWAIAVLSPSALD